jgi:hypothetical protein
MIILYLEVLIGICLIAVEIVMLHRIKRNNENWWRTYWAKNKVMMDKINELDKRVNVLVSDKEVEFKEYCKKNNIKSLADF